jgi:hypothetical protein
MSLLHFFGVCPTGKYFSAAFCFLSGETENDYLWALEQMTCLFPHVDGHSIDEAEATGISAILIAPEVVITDNETALKNALHRELPEIPQILCIWHINQNVLAHAQKAWITTDPWLSDEEREEIAVRRENFMKFWSKVSICYFFASSIVSSFIKLYYHC